MATLAEIRQQYPQYSDLSDSQLADSLYKTHYSDMPRDQFDAKLGIAASQQQGAHDPGAFKSFGRSAANAGAFGFMNPIDAAWKATFPDPGSFKSYDTPVSNAPNWSQRYSENLARDQAETGAEQKAHPVASFAGSVAGGMLNPVTNALPAINTLRAAILQGGGIGAGYGLGSAVSNQEGLGDTAADAAIGALTGGATGAAFHGLGRLLMPAQKTAAAQALEAEGVLPTIGQSLGGSAQRAEDALTSVPILGDAIKDRQLDAIKGFDRAAYNRILAPLGVKYPDTAPVGNEAIDTVSKVIDKAYTQAYSGAAINNNPGLQTALQNIVSDASNVLPPERVNLLQKNIDRLLNSKFDQSGVLSSDFLNTAKNWFAEQSRGGSAASMDERSLSDAYGKVLGAIRNEVANTDPGRASLLNSADNAYANYVRVVGASASNNASGKGGLFSPNQLGQAVRAADNTAHKAGFAKGNSLMQDLAQAGQEALTPTVPDSGTPFRTVMRNPAVLLTAPISMPALGLASTAYSPTGQKALNGLLFGAPQTRAALSKVPSYMLPGALALIGSSGSQNGP